MRTLLLTLHVVLAIFLIGPLVMAVNQAARSLGEGDTAALRLLARTVTIYGWGSLAVAVAGFGLVQGRYGNEFSDGWLLASIALFVVATVLVVAVLAPLLQRAVRTAAGGGSTRELVARAASLGGVASLCYLVIAVLMVWQPGD